VVVVALVPMDQGDFGGGSLAAAVATSTSWVDRGVSRGQEATENCDILAPRRMISWLTSSGHAALIYSAMKSAAVTVVRQW
jgi:hypothetical protein